MFFWFYKKHEIEQKTQNFDLTDAFCMKSRRQVPFHCPDTQNLSRSRNIIEFRCSSLVYDKSTMFCVLLMSERFQPRQTLLKVVEQLLPLTFIDSRVPGLPKASQLMMNFPTISYDVGFIISASCLRYHRYHHIINDFQMFLGFCNFLIFSRFF